MPPLSFPFGIGTKAANRCYLAKRSVYLISGPRFLHFTLNHYTSLPADFAAEPAKGLRLRTLDGNSLAGTDHRITCLRGSGAAALPGMSLVVREGRTGLLTNIVQCEDAYTNERTLYADILPLVKPNDLWLADRNFCTNDYLSGIEDRKAFFLIRHHAGTTLHPLGRETPGRSHPGGTISEQRVRAGASSSG